MGAIGSFILDKAIKYGIELLIKAILKWVEDQERQGKSPLPPKPNFPPENQGWNDKNKALK
jgi:hypothetical protein